MKPLKDSRTCRVSVLRAHHVQKSDHWQANFAKEYDMFTHEAGSVYSSRGQLVMHPRPTDRDLVRRLCEPCYTIPCSVAQLKMSEFVRCTSGLVTSTNEQQGPQASFTDNERCKFPLMSHLACRHSSRPQVERFASE